MKSILVGGVVLGLLVKTGSAAIGSLLGSSSERNSDGNNADNTTVGRDGDDGAVVTAARWRQKAMGWA